MSWAVLPVFLPFLLVVLVLARMAVVRGAGSPAGPCPPGRPPGRPVAGHHRPFRVRAQSRAEHIELTVSRSWRTSRWPAPGYRGHSACRLTATGRAGRPGTCREPSLRAWPVWLIHQAGQHDSRWQRAQLGDRLRKRGDPAWRAKTSAGGFNVYRS